MEDLASGLYIVVGCVRS